VKKKWQRGLFAVLGLALIFLGWRGLTKGLTADVLEVGPREIVRAFAEEGTVTAAEATDVYTGSGGKVTALPVREGDTVRSGELLVRFDTRNQTFLLAQLEGEMRSLQAAYAEAKEAVDLEKLQALLAAGAISEQEYEEAVRAAESDYYPGQIAALQARIDAARHEIAAGEVTAPRSGIVAQIAVREGMVVPSGSLLLSLYRGGDFQVEADLLAEDVALIKPGMAAEMRFGRGGGRDYVFPGTVVAVAPTATENVSPLGLTEKRVRVTLAPQVPAELTLRPGYSLAVIFTTERQTDVLAVPNTAVFPHGEDQAVWTVVEGKARLCPVATGFDNGRDIVITTGLKAGDLVIIDPQIKGLKEGAAVIY
jgi:HlyD family secretion protein